MYTTLWSVKGLEKRLSVPVNLIQFNRLSHIRKKILTVLAPFEVSVLKSKEPISKESLQNADFLPININERWAEDKFDCAWFKLKGSIPEGYESKNTVALISLTGEGLVYYENEPIGLTTLVISIADVFQLKAGKQIIDLSKIKDKSDFTLLADAGNNGITGQFVFSPKLRRAVIAEINEELWDYYYDYLTLLFLLSSEPNNELLDKDEARKIDVLLSKSYCLFSKGRIAEARSVLKEYYALEKEKSDRSYYLIGQAHLDLAWLWPKRESVRKSCRTFTNALAQIEKYPNYVFGASQAQSFEWVEQREPELFKRIQKAVKAGNIVIQGGMWTECDCNIPSGESIIRQFLYGEKYFSEKFGVSSDVCWLPDAFGFPSTLPQIIKGVGKSYFMTIKLSWNTFNRFPYQSFYWEAPDGSTVCSHIAPEGVYNSDASPMSLVKAESKLIQKTVDKALLIFGAGDGGGGASETSLEFIKRLNLKGLPKADIQSSEKFFTDLERDNKKKMPIYRGELYLEKHQGTFTSQAENKRLNRRLEYLLHTLEWLQAVKEDKTDLEEIWKTLLFNQFHDVIPGSSIERVHQESRRELSEASAKTETLIAKLIGTDESGCYAINPSPFSREELTIRDNKAYSVFVKAYSAAELKPVTISDLSVKGNVMENGFLLVEFDKKGNVSCLYEKETGIDYAEKPLSRLCVYRDKRTYYDAWDIDYDYIKRKPNTFKLQSSKLYVNPIECVAEQVFVYGKSRIVRYVRLRSNSRKLIFNYETDWHESHKMLRAEFAPVVRSDVSECDVQFGEIERSTKMDNAIDRARQEICMHYYVSVSDGKNRFSVINDCKYGVRVKEGVISMNLLRSPKYPDKQCDMGMHKYSYEILVSRNKSDVVAEGYNFNNPLLFAKEQVGISPIVSFDRENLIIENIKPLNEKKGFAVRVYERFGIETLAKAFADKKYEIYVSDMLEKNAVKNDSTFLLFKSHQIKTLLFIEKEMNEDNK